MIESRSPHAPHQSNLLKITSCVARVCFWLVVVFELPVGGHMAKTLFFDFLSRSVRRLERRDTPPHTRRRHHRQRGTVASDVGGGGSGALQ